MIQITSHYRKNLPPATERTIVKEVRETSTGFLSTHPSDASRMAMAQKANCEGLFHLDRPARDLIWHFEPLCTGVTWDFYRDQLGSHIMPDALTPSRELMKLDR